MTRWRDLVLRLAGPISRRPLTIAIVALLVGALGATGLLRFGVDAGQSLLVGSRSDAGQTYASFSQQFGSDPIVVVFAAHNPTAPYLERNLERLGAMEIDLAHDPRVASVLGPGTIAGSLRQAAVSEVGRVLTEYPFFIAETNLLFNRNGLTQDQLQQRVQTDVQNATTLLELYVAKAASDAHNARAAYVEKNGDKVIDSRERAADAAAAADPVPPLWAEYLAGPTQQADQAGAAQFFARVAAAYGDCSDQIAALLKIQPSCQVFFERTLLDLPNCPPLGQQLFCNPKPQWSAVLPTPRAGGDAYMIITVRLKPQYVGDQTAITSLRDKINNQLDHGIGSDSYTQSLSAASRANLQSLGALAPTECGGASAQSNAACSRDFKDARIQSVIAGAPLLGHGVVNSMTQLLIILFPVALLVMLLLLVGTFRVRGRTWPLLAALAATVLTIGISLLTGTSITPAVLAGVPVLVGLGVDYAVQLVARFAEERAAGTDREAAVRAVLSNTARATLVAALATLFGLAALALVGGIDWGPLVAVPLVAEFALVLCGGVVLAWLGGLFIALPLSVWSDSRRAAPAPAQAADSPVDTRRLARTVAIADNWKGVIAFASLLALAGWALLHTVPVQTDVQALLAPSLQELKDINVVQAETGYTNEVDIYLRGNVATGPVNSQTGNPVNVEWQCALASVIRTEHPDTVATASSIGDYIIASGSSTTGSGAAASCVPPASSQPSPSPSPSPSPGASASPSGSATPTGAASASPTAARHSPAAAIAVDRVAAREAAATATPAESGAASPSAAASGSASPSASASPTPSPAPSTSNQTRFLCDLRLFPLLSRTLIQPLGPDTLPCPPLDEYQQTFLSHDSSPISPNAARVAIGVHTNSVADQARLVNALRGDSANAPNGMSASPTGLAVLATTAYDNLVNRSYVLNLVPLLIVAIGLFAIYREPRRALLPLLPTALAAGWAPLVLLLLGRLPGGVGSTLGALNPLTVVLGALVVALGTEFGVVLLGRFYEERQRGLDPDAAAGAALGGVGRAIRVSALTLGAGFAVLAVSGLFPNSLPLVADFGLAVVIDLALAVAAVFYVMLPLAVALERRSALQLEPEPVAERAVKAPARSKAPARPRPTAEVEEEPVREEPEPEAPVSAAPSAPAATPRRLPGVSGRRRPSRPAGATAEPEPEAAPKPPRKPGVSGRKRRRR